MLSKSERDAIRTELEIRDVGNVIVENLLDDLDAKDREIAEREMTIAAFRDALVRQGCACRKGIPSEGESPHKCYRCEVLESNDAGRGPLATIAAIRKALESALKAEYCNDPAECHTQWHDDARAALQPDAGAKLLADHAKQLAAYRKAARALIEKAWMYHGAWIGEIAAEVADLDKVLQSSDPGSALLAEHAAELEKIRTLMHDALDRAIRRGEEIIAMRQRAEAAALAQLRQQIEQQDHVIDTLKIAQVEKRGVEGLGSTGI